MTKEFLIELLQKNVRVILPDFGAFLLKDDGSEVFKPQNLTFSPFLKYNDGMLENSLATKKKITKDKAKERIEDFIEELKNELAANKTYELPGIGLLYTDQRGSVFFKPITAEGEEADKTAKPEVTKPVIAKEPPKKEEAAKSEQKKEIPKKPVAQPDEPKVKATAKPEEPAKIEPPKEVTPEKPMEVPVQKPEPKAEAQEVVSKEEKQEEPAKAEIPKMTAPIPKKVEPPVKPTSSAKPTQQKQDKAKRSGGTGRAILTGILFGLGLVVLLIGGWYLYDSGIAESTLKKVKKPAKVTQTETLPEVEIEEFDNIPQEDIAQEEMQTKQRAGEFDDEFNKLSQQMDKTSQSGDPKEEVSKTRISQTPKSEKTVIVPQKKEGVYHIIVGSFRNVTYAEKLADDMNSSGYKSRVITQPSGMHAVTLGTFLARQEAEDSMNVWKLQHPNIWILNQ